MLWNHPKRGRLSPPLKYLIIAAAVAVVSIAVLEALGTAMTSNYKGLGGRLGADDGSAVAPATMPRDDLR